MFDAGYFLMIWSMTGTSVSDSPSAREVSKMKKLKTPALVIAVTLMFALATSGCGTLMYSQRITAKPSNKIDAKVVVLDCLWFFVMVIPGVVALGVDLYNGTIYYSEDELKEQEGDDVSVNIPGRAPADSLLTLWLLDRDGCDMDIPVEARSCAGTWKLRTLGRGFLNKISDAVYAEGEHDAA